APSHAKAAPTRSFGSAPSGLLQRKCVCGGSSGLMGQCAECDEKRLQLQRRADDKSTSSYAPTIVREVLRSPGQPLDGKTRALMESRFGHDFSHVRVHADSRAAESARAVNAVAYTVGHDIVFSTRQYIPHTHVGQRLLAHELAHTVQNSDSPGLSHEMEISHPDAPAEREAENAAARFADNEPIQLFHRGATRL